LPIKPPNEHPFALQMLAEPRRDTREFTPVDPVLAHPLLQLGPADEELRGHFIHGAPGAHEFDRSPPEG